MKQRLFDLLAGVLLLLCLRLLVLWASTYEILGAQEYFPGIAFQRYPYASLIGKGYVGFKGYVHWTPSCRFHILGFRFGMPNKTTYP